jgi:hypothetical protein
MQVVQIVAQQHQQRRLTAGDELALHVEEKFSMGLEKGHQDNNGTKSS